MTNQRATADTKATSKASAEAATQAATNSVTKQAAKTVVQATQKAATRPATKAPARKPTKVTSEAKPAAKNAAKTATQNTVKNAAKKPVKNPVDQTAQTKALIAKEKADKARKPKIVRDSFTMPKAEYAAIDLIKERAALAGRPAKKSELLRAGIKLLGALTPTALVAALSALPEIKTGRPAKD